MRFGLKALVVDSEQILHFLASRNFSDTAVGQSFQQPRSRVSEKLNKLLSRLRDSCEPFGESDEPIPIALRSAVQRLIGVRDWEEIGRGACRPHALFQLANLATFAATILTPDAQSSHDFGVLATMWEQFPSPFTSGFEESADGALTPGNSRLLDSTFDVGLEVRTQFAIVLLSERRSDPNFYPETVLRDVFFLENDEESTQFLGFNVEGLSTQDNSIPKKFETQVLERIQAIDAHFSEHVDRSVNIKSLADSFPWEIFLAQIMSWVNARAAELNHQIDDQGGVSQIQQSLQEGAHRTQNPTPSDAYQSQERAPISPPKQVGGSNNVIEDSRPRLPTKRLKSTKPAPKTLNEQAKRLLQLKAQVAQTSIAAEAPGDVGVLPESNFDRKQLLGAEDEAPPASTLQEILRDPSVNKEIVAKVYATVEKQARQSNKENIDITSRHKSFIDRQKGAQKVPFEDGSQEILSDSRRKNVSPGKRRSTRTEAGDDDEDEDDAFEAMDDGPANQRRRELHAKTNQRRRNKPSAPKRARSEIPESVQSATGANDRAGSDPANLQAVLNQQLSFAARDSSPARPSQRPPLSSQPSRKPLRTSHSTNTPPSSSPPATRSIAQQLEYVREAARRTVTTIKPRRVQSRVTYSREEEERLVDLIEEYGISYTLIKQMDGKHPDGALLQNRTQVHIKDKAQELKFQLLK
jgi:hypothetical protein